MSRTSKRVSIVMRLERQKRVSINIQPAGLPMYSISSSFNIDAEYANNVYIEGPISKNGEGGTHAQGQMMGMMDV